MESISKKILNLSLLEKKIETLRENGVTVGLCHGTFDLLHIGHIKHFKEAKSLCDVLIVTITPDVYVNKGPNRPIFSEGLRSEAIAALECVDFIGINAWPTAIELIKKLKPNKYFKGIDYNDASKDITGNIELEREAIEEQGGKLIITTSEKYSSSNIILREFSNFDEKQIQFIDILKSKYETDYFFQILDKLKKIQITLVGEIIIDEYVYCETIGKSGKEAMLVNRITDTEKFLGGIGAVARICADFVSKINVVTYVGSYAQELEFISMNLPGNVTFSSIDKEASPTIKKTRYVNEYTKQKLIGFYDLNDEPLNDVNQQRLNLLLDNIVPMDDLLIEIDYGHGLVTKKFQELLREKARFLAANSQVNSFNAKYRDLNLYSAVDLICMNEDELRLHYRNRNAPILHLIERLKVDLSCGNVVITRGANGSIGVGADGEITECPAYAEKVVDRIGSGDAYLAICSLALFVGASLSASMFLASVVAGAVVSSVGTGQQGLKPHATKLIEMLLK